MGHVNVPGKLHICSMLRSARIGVGWGMLTFLVSKLHSCWMRRNGRVGVGWGMLTTVQLLTIYSDPEDASDDDDDDDGDDDDDDDDDDDAAKNQVVCETRMVHFHMPDVQNHCVVIVSCLFSI